MRYGCLQKFYEYRTTPPAHETSRDALEHEVRMSSPSERWSDRPAWRLEPRTKRRTPLDGESPAVKTGSLARMDPHLIFVGVNALQQVESSEDLLSKLDGIEGFKLYVGELHGGRGKGDV